jgi:hypothetical protein
MLTMAGITACTPDANVARHTVDEYRANTALRHEILAQCLNNPGTLGENADCINAREAERLESLRPLRDQAPIGLRSGVR